MLRFVRQVVNEEQDFPTVIIPTQFNVLDNTIDSNGLDLNTTPFIVVLDNNNTNSTNGSSLISAFSSSPNKQGFSWEFNWNLIILLALGLIFITVIISAGIWYWCNRVHRLRRQHSLPLAVNDFIETTKIQEKRLSTSPIINSSNKAPPVPPRPTAYTTILGKVEYRSNL